LLLCSLLCQVSSFQITGLLPVPMTNACLVPWGLCGIISKSSFLSSAFSGGSTPQKISVSFLTTTCYTDSTTPTSWKWGKLPITHTCILGPTPVPGSTDGPNECDKWMN
jgi:hypothetical protein